MSRLDLAPHMQCAVCGNLLAPVDPGEPQPIFYLHVLLSEDHAPVPTPMEAHPQLLCDFCGEPTAVTYTLKTMPFKQARQPGQWAGYLDDGQWCACPTCVELIRKKDWETVLDRAERSLLQAAVDTGMPRAVARRGIADMHAAFRDNWNGKIPEEPDAT